jgi:hypothetical protein
MPTQNSAPPNSLEDAEAAYKRIEPHAIAVTDDQFSAINIDPIAATSVMIGVASRILAYRERMAKLPEFDIVMVDQLEDRAKAAWYAAITNLPVAEAKDFQQLFQECVTLRTKLLLWAGPLAHAGHFEQAAIDKIKEGAGNKDVPSDVVALVALYRSKWEDIKDMCGVTEAELERGGAIGPTVFATVSRRENKAMPSHSDGSLRVRRFWTLADTAYSQCQRAIAYLEWGKVDYTTIAPSLRKNAGVRPTRAEQPEAPSDPESTASPGAAAPASPSAPGLGGNGSPFTTR